MAAGDVTLGQGCPQNYKWTPWSVWSSCGQSCGQGTKERVRSCRPAVNGGKACPVVGKNPDLYRQVEKCYVQDCEVYRPGQWSAWSDCSASCGPGEKVRHRACYSQQQQAVHPVYPAPAQDRVSLDPVDTLVNVSCICPDTLYYRW